MKSAAELVQAYKQIYERVDREGRRPTRQENEEIQDLLDRAIDQKSIEDKVSALGMEIGAPSSSGWLQNGSFSGGGPGDVFIRSEGYKAVQHPDTRKLRVWPRPA
jgi:hypothetical protein